ncbi:4'-phosphopantetheinyl transferase superfamily protein [Kitasatospora sp. NPDC049258]|uniref:4'-phosphopantetheinyl transferase family protein n=1 Tax=Kitasatospora sp. NPDC049258 TaxID=3155394 RepID=UPI0034167542
MISLVLPGAVAWAESFGEHGEGRLLPQEERLTTAMVPARRAEFTAVRACARQALGRLGLPPVPILPGPRGEPRWPRGIVGSMTHCAGYRAAAVARGSDLPVLGIDAEPHQPLPPGVLTAVSLPQERSRRHALRRADPGIHWDRLLFSAKEAVFKAWYPMTGRPLDFADADVVLTPDGTWWARLRLPHPPGAPHPRGFTGRWLVSDGLVLTAATAPLR